MFLSPVDVTLFQLREEKPSKRLIFTLTPINLSESKGCPLAISSKKREK
jgi:hypothetical protein